MDAKAASDIPELALTEELGREADGVVEGQLRMMLVGVTDTAWTVLHVHEGTVERSRMSNHASMDEPEAYLVRLLTTFATVEPEEGCV